MNFIDWLFNSPTGVAVLIFGGMLIFVIIAIIAEHRTHKMFYNHEPEADEDDWEDDDDDWDDDDDEDDED